MAAIDFPSSPVNGQVFSSGDFHGHIVQLLVAGI